MAHPGRLRETFEVQAPSRMINSGGQRVVSVWSVYATMRGRFMQDRGGEVVAGGAYEGRRPVKIEMRYMDGMTTEMRVVHLPTGRVYEISSVPPLNVGVPYIVLDCVEVA